MSLGTFLRRAKRTSWAERLLLAEAVAALAMATLAIRLFPFKSLARLASPGGKGRGNGHENRIVDGTVWAIKAATPYLPWRIACFQEGLALHAMLRRRGVASFLHYGVGQSPDRGLTAHVWVSVDGRILIGEDGAGDHACLAIFPTMAERP